MSADLIFNPTYEWKEIKVVKNSINRHIDAEDHYDTHSDEGLGPQYYHKCAPVFYTQREKSWDEYVHGKPILTQSESDFEDSDLFMKDLLIEMPPIKWEQVDDYLYREGIYFFGGKSTLGKLNNDIW